MMSKYIDKEELWERLRKRIVHHMCTNTLFNTIKAVIDGMPTIEVSEDNKVLYGTDHNCILTMFGECSYNETGCSDCAVAEKIRNALSVEVSEDCISREWLETNFQTVCENVRCSECPFDDDDCRLIKFIVDAPSVVPNCSEKPNNCEGEWQRISPAYIYQCSVCGGNVMTQDIECYKYCHQCGAKMKGEDE